MSLKQEFIDMVRLITEPLEAESEYERYCLEVDPMVDVCELDGSDVTYIECDDCENQQDCTSRKYVRVDVSFTDYGDCNRLYVFNKKPPVDKGVRAIWNRKQLMREIFDLKKEIEELKDYYATFGSRHTELLQYAKEFVEELQRDFTFFIPLNENVLPIVFHLDCMKDGEGKDTYKTSGNVQWCRNQSVINVLYDEDIEKTKTTIRHEILHYGLNICGMKSSDDEAVFHFLCNKYDANAYMEMPESEKELYDNLELAISRIEKAFEEQLLCIPNIEKDENVVQPKEKDYISSMVYAVGAKDENDLYKGTTAHEDMIYIGNLLMQMLLISNDNL